MTEMQLMGEKARIASRHLSRNSTKRTEALFAMAKTLQDKDIQAKILSANSIDISNARSNGISDAMVDRLKLTEDRLSAMADGIISVSALPDPIGKLIEGRTLPNGLKVEKVTVPLGVIGMIFESRPNVASDVSSLCIKAGSAAILRGGKEAINSNIAIIDCLREAIKSVGLDENLIQLIKDTSRNSAAELMNLTGYIDVLIPRGGKGLIKSVVENSKVPVIETGAGNCHIYVDKFADIDMATEIVFNAKTSRPSVCNAAEKMIIHSSIYKEALPKIISKLAEKDVEIRGDERTVALLDCKKASEDDWYEEYNDYIMSVKVVDSIEEAIEHIEKYSTKHSEAIITNDYSRANLFTSAVDSACVYVNASTRFTDGGEMGLGAEIGISTQKLHARGPMGLNEIVSYKYIINGEGQVR